MAFCTKCGAQLADGANFCAGCGTPTGAAAQGNAAGTSAQAGGTAKTVDEALKELNELAGLASVKEAVAKIASMAQAQKLIGVTQPLYRHFVFMGNPGTGKTAVARIMGDVFKALGILPTNNVVEADRSNMVGAYVGQTAMQVSKICDSAMGGILFIDEAYSLLQGQGDMFGQEAVDTLLKRMEDDRGKFMVIISGYAKEMEAFLQSATGLKSRFTDLITFEDFNAPEMREIFIGMCKMKNIQFGPGFDEALQKKLADIYTARDANFANARTVRMFFDKTYEKLTTRVIGMKSAGASEDEMKRELCIMRPEDL